MSFFKKKAENKPDDINVSVENASQVESIDDDEIVAVISAAVASYMGSGFRIASISESSTVVRSLRVGEQNSPWVQYSRMRNVRV
ncbi:MAG: OadG family protein [Defluviitaleaceae bacterium]|nr:OadG family protein [Defluviitaleaceae bacterium]